MVSEAFFRLPFDMLRMFPRLFPKFHFEFLLCPVIALSSLLAVRLTRNKPSDAHASVRVPRIYLEASNVNREPCKPPCRHM
jgi:hypothetical protein